MSPPPLAPALRPWSVLAGPLLFLMILLALVAGSGHGWPVWPAGLAAWGAGLLRWPHLDRRQRQQCLGLAGLGVAAFVWAHLRGQHGGWGALLTQNTPLLAMLAAVGFLQLVRLPGHAAALPQGRGALWRTLAGVHVLGAFINMSVLFIMADRLRQTQALTEAHAALLTRGFLAAALWSPFFAAMAVALTYAPGAGLGEVALAGAPFALILLLWAGKELIRSLPDGGRTLAGYPIEAGALMLPLLLATLVVAGHHTLPGWHSLALIAASALLLSLGATLFQRGLRPGTHALVHHVVRQLPAMQGELALFLAAAVFASGLQALMATDLALQPFTRFGPLEAALTLAAMMGLALAGVHAVVSISMVAAWVAPLAPDPVLLALVFLQNWAIGLAGGPLSGVHLAFQGRYGLAASGLARRNARYCLGGYLLAVGWIGVVSAWRGLW